ncbi:transmembrane protein 208-like [Asterias rubens]|uniref:transmembrane protein 208-like n=1 Tax=Asterias rubens TaxID=7604 RepID=UPI00145576EA|nr:transmembrane protein 208-like [Asterias rubens]
MAPKGKVATKGQKQIAEENKQTLIYYRNIMFGASAAYVVVRLLWWLESFTWLHWLLLIFASSVYFGCYQFMAFMAKAKYSSTGSVVDGGVDLNMENGMAEHVKDILLVTAVIQVLSIMTDYFWLLWLVIPGRAFYLLWTTILAPWFFAPAAEVDDKKQKKMERKMQRR